MRTIKFRAWDAQNKRMIEPVAWVSWNGSAHGADSKFITTQSNVMQYTGLTDRNGKEIYEGDIVKGKDDDGNRIIGEVQYRVTRYSVNGVGKYVFIQCSLNREFEIIGNRYENLKLIEVSA